MTAPAGAEGAPRQVSPPRFGRFLLLGFLLLLAGGVAWLLWRPAGPPPPMPEVIKDREVAQAVDQARQGVLDQPASAAAWGYLGKVFMANLFSKEAKTCFQQARKLDPADPHWPYALAIMAQYLEPDRAVPLLRESLELAGSRPRLRTAIAGQLAEALLNQGQDQEAEAMFRKELDLDPNNPRAHLGLGMIGMVRGDEKMARTHLRLATASSLSRQRATAQLAMLARRGGETEAAQAYDQALAQMPQDPTWPDPFQDEIASMPVGFRGRERHATYLEDRGLFREAAEMYLKRAQDEPTAENYIGAGINFSRLKEYDRAIEVLRKAVDLEPKNSRGLYTLELVLFTRAETLWKTAPEKRAEAEAGFREAIEIARRATTERVDYAHAYLFWGLALKFLGKPAEALEPLRKAAVIAPGDFEAQLGLGEVLLQTDRPEEARLHLENARRMRPDDPRLSPLLEKLPPPK